ncbi:uncharacterized protein LOC126836049 isoform X2 [Adelges cooleyi]|uniref:uncharacterized protein LOC126836049 isoform X2 n=1 Tax=Adelges cooleyi TaxID=133065 RepID=UPI00217FE502|nr:uncharacterized protein LOC126836049 isoform X2 [Adelges cooleyi]
MASNELDRESKAAIFNNLDLYGKLESILKGRNKIIYKKDLKLPCALADDKDLVDILAQDDAPTFRKNKRLEAKEKAIADLIDDVRKLKRSSEIEMDFPIESSRNEAEEVNQAISRLRQQSEKIFKQIIVSENNSHIKTHSKIIEETCKYDRGIDAIIRCDKDTLAKSVNKDFQPITVDEFKNEYNNLAQGVLNNIYDDGLKTAKNHEHFLAIKKFNKPNLNRSNIEAEVVTTGVLDPFTRQPITRPIRNKLCNHIYDQDSVELMFHARSVVPCPYIGCTNKHFTKKDLLEHNTSGTSNNQ